MSYLFSGGVRPDEFDEIKVHQHYETPAPIVCGASILQLNRVVVAAHKDVADSVALVSGVHDRTPQRRAFVGEENPRIRAVVLQVAVEHKGEREGVQSQE